MKENNPPSTYKMSLERVANYIISHIERMQLPDNPPPGMTRTDVNRVFEVGFDAKKEVYAMLRTVVEPAVLKQWVKQQGEGE